MNDNEGKFKNRFEVAQSMEYEGPVYFFTGYARSNQMPDEVLVAKFDQIDRAYEDFLELIDEFKIEVGL